MPKTFFNSRVQSPVVVTPETVVLEMDGYTAELVYDILFDVLNRIPEEHKNSEPGQALEFVVEHFTRVKSQSPVIDLIGQSMSLRVR